MEIEVRAYEPWMEDQVCALFEMNYGVELEDFRRFFKAFYESSFQSDACIRLAALEGDTVIGFQSYFYWPMASGANRFRAYQSGNSLVHEDHRGKGVFGKLLKAGDRALEEKNAQLLIGFPVNASLGSFIRAGWNGDIQLHWYVKPLFPLNVILPKKLGSSLSLVDSIPHFNEVERLSSAAERDFFSWRKGYHEDTYFEIQTEHAGARLLLILKRSVRMKILHELVIGEVYTDSEDPELLEVLVAKAMKEIRRSFRGFSFISFAINAFSDRQVDRIILEQGFRRIDRQINFVFKSLDEKLELPEPSGWALYRGDIDTW